MHPQALLDRLVSSNILSAYERDYELDKLSWYYDEMGGGVEGKRAKNLGSRPVAGRHYRPCMITTGNSHSHAHTLTHTPFITFNLTHLCLTTGDSQDAFHTSFGIFANNHTLDKPFAIQSDNTVSK